MRYNVGDKVLVREDLECGKIYTGVAFYDSMMKFCGKVLTIRGKYGGTPNNEPCYIVEENPYDWSDDMFSRLISESNNKVTRENKEMRYKIGDHVKVRNDLVRGIRYSDMYFTESMEKYRGKVLTITNNNTLFSGRTPCYDVAECYCLWTDEMFEEFIENKVEENKMKYNVGDKVRVREDLEIGQMFDNKHMFTKSMSEYRGKTVTIASFNEDSYTIGMVRMRGKIVTIKSVHRDYYLIKEDEGFWSWTDEMFEEFIENKVEEIVMKYNVGDKVRVREDLEIGQMFDNKHMFTKSMSEYRGKTVTIASFNEDSYTIEEAFSIWTDEMFEGLAEGAEKKENKMKYKPGDKVRVRNDLEFDKDYGDWNFTSGMIRMRGKIVTIRSVHRDYYLIKEDEDFWSWTDEMFEGLASEKWSIEIVNRGDLTSVRLFEGDERNLSRTANFIQCSTDAPDIEVTAKAAINQLFRREPKFHDGDIVSRACGYYRVVGVPIYDNKCNSFVYDLAITPGNKTLTSEPIRENELTLVCRPRSEK